MDESRIGQYVARLRSSSTTGPAHIVESEIAGDVITRCGRRMAPKTADGYGLLVLDPRRATPGECLSCYRAAPTGGG